MFEDIIGEPEDIDKKYEQKGHEPPTKLCRVLSGDFWSSCDDYLAIDKSNTSQNRICKYYQGDKCLLSTIPIK